MNKMAEVLKKLADASKDANKSLEEIHPSMRPGWSMRIAAGQQNMVDLAAEYKVLLNGAIKKKVFTMGAAEDVAKFNNLLGELGVNGLAADASAMYRRITDAVAGSMGMRGEFSLQQFSLMNSTVGDIAVENPEMDIKDALGDFVPSITSYEALLNHVRASFRATNGNKTNVALMNKRILKQALALELTEPTVLFIRGAIQDELADISLAVVGGPAVVLAVPPSPTLEWVQEAIAELGLISTPEVPEGEAAPAKKRSKKSNPSNTNPTEE